MLQMDIFIFLIIKTILNLKTSTQKQYPIIIINFLYDFSDQSIPCIKLPILILNYTFVNKVMY